MDSFDRSQLTRYKIIAYFLAILLVVAMSILTGMLANSRSAKKEAVVEALVNYSDKPLEDMGSIGFSSAKVLKAEAHVDDQVTTYTLDMKLLYVRNYVFTIIVSEERYEEAKKLLVLQRGSRAMENMNFGY